MRGKRHKHALQRIIRRRFGFRVSRLAWQCLQLSVKPLCQLAAPIRMLCHDPSRGLAQCFVASAQMRNDLGRPDGAAGHLIERNEGGSLNFWISACEAIAAANSLGIIDFNERVDYRMLQNPIAPLIG
jgi:hypothetical protein